METPHVNWSRLPDVVQIESNRISRRLKHQKHHKSLQQQCVVMLAVQLCVCQNVIMYQHVLYFGDQLNPRKQETCCVLYTIIAYSRSETIASKTHLLDITFSGSIYKQKTLRIFDRILSSPIMCAESHIGKHNLTGHHVSIAKSFFHLDANFPKCTICCTYVSTIL